MRDYLATVRDAMLLSKPFPKGEDKDLTMWQVLLLGVQTDYQDYVFHAYGHPVP